MPGLRLEEPDEPRSFNLMFKTTRPVEDDSNAAWLRPETRRPSSRSSTTTSPPRAEGALRRGAEGKSFRNEINPRNYTFRRANSSRWNWNSSSAPTKPWS